MRTTEQEIVSQKGTTIEIRGKSYSESRGQMQKLCELSDYSVTSEIPHTKYQILVVLKYHILLQGLHFKEDTEKFGHNAFLKNEHKNYSRAEKIM